MLMFILVRTSLPLLPQQLRLLLQPLCVSLHLLLSMPALLERILSQLGIRMAILTWR